MQQLLWDHEWIYYYIDVNRLRDDYRPIWARKEALNFIHVCVLSSPRQNAISVNVSHYLCFNDLTLAVFLFFDQQSVGLHLT